MTLPISITAAKSLLDIYTISNTPAFLFQRFREHQTVQRLAKEETSIEMASEFARLAGIASANDNALATAICYALVVAISLRPYEEALPVLNSMPVERLPWGSALRGFAIASGKPFNLLIVNEPSPAYGFQASAASNTTTLVKLSE